jgi:magnesium-transporting ATPase (P-type)
MQWDVNWGTMKKARWSEMIPASRQQGTPAVQDSSDQQLYGLREAEAAERLERDGFNELPSAKVPSLWRTIVTVLREPMLLLLVAAGVVYLLLGDPLEAGALLIAVFLIIGINRWLWMVVLGSISTLLVVLYVPVLRRLSRSSALHISDLLLAALAGFLGVLWFEILKLVALHFRGLKVQPKVKA